MTTHSSVLPWSYSSTQAYTTCPRRFYLTKIAKVVSEPQTAATLHGNEVHRAFEKFLKGEAGIPEKFKDYTKIAERVRAQPGNKFVEHKFALTQTLKPTTFFAKDAWVRGVIDVAVVNGKKATLIDWKTGKPKPDADQMRLFAAVGFAIWPHVEEADTAFVWLKDKSIDRERFKREDAAELWQPFLPTIQRMQRSVETDEWEPRPSGLCREWCPVGKKLCEFCGKD